MLLLMYRKPALSDFEITRLLKQASLEKVKIQTENCFYVEHEKTLTAKEIEILNYLIAERMGDGNVSEISFLSFPTELEFGPRLNFETSYSTTAVEICHLAGVTGVTRLERSRRFGFSKQLTAEEKSKFIEVAHDRMTEMLYERPLMSLTSNLVAEPLRVISLIEDGRKVMEDFNREFGCGWDNDDIDFGLHHFTNVLKCNPTDAVLFMIAQAISDHSRHNAFGGKIYENDVAKKSFFEMIKWPWEKNPGNSLIAFEDDASAIVGPTIEVMAPSKPGYPSPFILVKKQMDQTVKVESHNHPTLISPFEGAATCIGGDLRDVMVPDHGGLVGVGGAVFYSDNLMIPGYIQPWEKGTWKNPAGTASGLEIQLKGSFGFFNYGNAFGLGTIFGSMKTYGLMTAQGRKACTKPTFLGAVIGEIDSINGRKERKLEPGMLVIQIGGPGYRVGIGGAAASSMGYGENSAELDFKSVQRGDPLMGQLIYRPIVACVEMGKDNPIWIAGDLGAGGHANSLFELLMDSGGEINLRQIPIGDQSLSALEILGNESQERINVILKPENLTVFQAICRREGTPCAILGKVSGDGWLRIIDPLTNTVPVELKPKEIIDNRPRKKYQLERTTVKLKPLQLPKNLSVRKALDLVLRLPAVASKSFLTRGVDRSVGGRIARQQCVGPNHLPLADFALRTAGYFTNEGVAMCLGDRFSIGEISTPAMARMSVAESLLNIIGAGITSLEDMKFTANWMWPIKLPGERARMWDAAESLSKIVEDTVTAIIGGKDSSSMSVRTKDLKNIVKTVAAPGQTVITAIAPVEDVTKHLTPDFKKPGNAIILIDFAKGKRRLGGSALAQVHGQVGDECPDIENGSEFGKEYARVMEIIFKTKTCSVHDVSDGGLITTILEMAFTGNTGFEVEIKNNDNLAELFSEEAMVVVETSDPTEVMLSLVRNGITCHRIGEVGNYGGNVKITNFNNKVIINEPMTKLRQIWEETSYQLDLLQANPKCVEEERQVMAGLVKAPPFKLTFAPKQMNIKGINKPKVAMLRSPGSNSDREMTAAFYAAGFEPWDIHLTDLLEGKISLDDFRGASWVGGWSFRDVMEAGKGVAAIIKYGKQGKLLEEFSRFYERPDTFSLDTCNGNQIRARLGWDPKNSLPETEKPLFIRNLSGRFESRFSWVKVMPGPALMFQGMAGSILGVWVAHGEGYLDVSQKLLNQITDQQLAPLCFVDMNGNPTETYPFNPNGSPCGITALCSPDGRHLSMMPHPERTFLKTQAAWSPGRWKSLLSSPWLKMFQNAYDWCAKK